jgi:hypothetical protein
MEEGGFCSYDCFGFFGEATIAADPGKTSFDYAATGMHGETYLPDLFANNLGGNEGCIRDALTIRSNCRCHCERSEAISCPMTPEIASIRSK